MSIPVACVSGGCNINISLLLLSSKDVTGCYHFPRVLIPTIDNATFLNPTVGYMQRGYKDLEHGHPLCIGI